MNNSTVSPFILTRGVDCKSIITNCTQETIKWK